MKLNIYKTSFKCQCPNNGQIIDYKLKIESESFIQVENLLEFISNLKPDFHETIADSLFDKFDGLQTMTATHHGVEIKTLRGEK